MDITPIVKWMEKSLKSLQHGYITVSINVTDGKIVFVRQRIEETKKILDTGAEEKYSIDEN